MGFNLSPLEEDFLSEMSHDDHELWELYGFARLHHPDSNDDEVAKIVIALILQWLERDWLAALQSRKAPVDMPSEQLLRNIMDLGPSATNPEKGVILLRLTERASIDIEWLNVR